TFAAARLAYHEGELRRAETLLARAREMTRELPERAIAEAATDVALGGIYVAESRMREADLCLQKCMTSLQSFADPAHKELLAVALRFHSEALVDAGDVRGAEKELERSADILLELGSDSAVQLAYTYSDLCGLYITQGRFSEADRYMSLAMQIIGTVFDAENPAYVRADMLYELSHPMTEDARMELVSNGLQKMEYAYGAHHPHIKRALLRYFKALDERGLTEKMKSAVERFGVRPELKAKK
ncbi:MAG TPA: hypothetical protein V6C72_03325, partial [Chroococcales cyanobacterium]